MDRIILWPRAGIEWQPYERFVLTVEHNVESRRVMLAWTHALQQLLEVEYACSVEVGGEVCVMDRSERGVSTDFGRLTIESSKLLDFDGEHLRTVVESTLDDAANAVAERRAIEQQKVDRLLAGLSSDGQ